jgi:hypothetical protein
MHTKKTFPIWNLLSSHYKAYVLTIQHKYRSKFLTFEIYLCTCRYAITLNFFFLKYHYHYCWQLYFYALRYFQVHYQIFTQYYFWQKNDHMWHCVPHSAYCSTLTVSKETCTHVQFTLQLFPSLLVFREQLLGQRDKPQLTRDHTGVKLWHCVSEYVHVKIISMWNSRVLPRKI